MLLQSRCITCSDAAPPCPTCPSNQQCVIISRGCDQCAVAQCVANDSPTASSGSGGVSKGAMAGGIVGVLIFLGATIALFLWYRRYSRRIRTSAGLEAKPDVPASAETVLSRLDPIEKHLSTLATTPASNSNSVRVYNSSSNTTIDLDPASDSRACVRASTHSNPFTDTHSIQTTSNSTQSTNVIPIALVPHGGITSQPQSPTSAAAPTRPARSPDLNIRMDPMSFDLAHVNVSSSTLGPPNMPYARSPGPLSQYSGMSGASSRMSYMSGGSFASDVLTEAPQIVTPASGGAVRQVLGVARAEVIKAPPLSPDSQVQSHGLRPMPPTSARTPGRSPLAQTAFNQDASPTDHGDEGQEVTLPFNPFSDEHTPMAALASGKSGAALSPAASVTTFGTPSPRSDNRESNGSNGVEYQDVQGAGSDSASDWVTKTWESTAVDLPSASSTSAYTGGGVALRSPRTGDTLSPASAHREGTLEEQQAQALAYARARAAASGGGIGRRVSASSVASAGGDSLLESFTFVPPSPISSRPPRSPLGQSAFAHPSPSPQPQQKLQTTRQQQHMSTASAMSGASALEGFTFRIDGGSGGSAPSSYAPPSTRATFGSASRGRESDASGLRGPNSQRASLDTLALTQDLSAFPLNFDSNSHDSFGLAK